MRNDFAIFILTHGRPTAQHTMSTLINLGYSGTIYLVVDDTDNTLNDYLNTYDNVIVFDKNHYINSIDVATNNPMFKSILYGKCAAEDIAKELGLKAFAVVDDDLVGFRFRYAEDNSLKSLRIMVI